MDKKKILIYNQAFFLISETFIYRQTYFFKKKYDVHLVAKNFINPHGFNLDGLTCHLIRKPESFISRAFSKMLRTRLNTNLNIDINSFLQLRKLLRKGDISTVFAHFGPYAVEILGLAKAYNIPLIAAFHGHDASGMLRDKKYARMLPDLFNYASIITISSKHMFTTLKLDKWKKKVRIIPYGVNPSEFTINGQNKKESDDINILHAGRVVPTKGVPDLIRSFLSLADKYKNIKLKIAGDGSELEHCKQIAANSNHNKRITFYGSVSQERLKKFLAESDIFVLNSRTDDRGDMEGTPNTILESMCMGKAVVSTVHAGIPYVIKHNENGLLAKEYANDELKDCIEKFITSSDLRKKLGKNAQRTIKSKYTIELMQEKILEAIDDVISNTSNN